MYVAVGLTDYWSESVCLWHQMMHDAGPALWPNEFQNERPGRLSETKTGGTYNTSEYGVGAGHVVDPIDQQLYEHGRAVFLRNLDAFSGCDVAVERCGAETTVPPTGRVEGSLGSPSSSPPRSRQGQGSREARVHDDVGMMAPSKGKVKRAEARPRKVGPGRSDPATWRC